MYLSSFGEVFRKVCVHLIVLKQLNWSFYKLPDIDVVRASILLQNTNARGKGARPQAELRLGVVMVLWGGGEGSPTTEPG